MALNKSRETEMAGGSVVGGGGGMNERGEKTRRRVVFRILEYFVRRMPGNETKSTAPFTSPVAMERAVAVKDTFSFPL